MVFGVGIDIVSVDRIEKALSRFADLFLERAFGEKERPAPGSPRRAAEYFAGRFAAKEAFLKALGVAKGGIRLREIQVVADDGERPSLELTGTARRIVEANGIKNVHVSLSHEREYAVAVVVLEL